MSTQQKASIIPNFDGVRVRKTAEIIAEYKVSRPTVREAIRILESEGLISLSRGARGGARICSPTFNLVARAAGVALQSKGAMVGDIYEMRTIIEPPAARLVAERGGKAAAAVLREQLDLELSLIDDRLAASKAIADFHLILMELCGNATLTVVASSLQDLVERHLALARRREPPTDVEILAKRLRFGFRSHARLIEYVEDGDGEAAEKHWLNHMRAAGTYWLQVVAPTTVVELLE